jgi:phosphotransferase system HPr (HPr) family protein
MSAVQASRQVVVANPQGLHLRPADLIVRLASTFESTVELVKGHERVDAKSILTILSLAVRAGTPLLIEANGADAQRAVDALADLIEQGFNENDNEDHG